MSVYIGLFGNERDICEQFQIETFTGHVLFAAYECPDYEGSAVVLFVHEGKIYLVEGSHCSCYGLEDQWRPDEMPLKALRHIVDKGWGLLHDYRDTLNVIFDEIEALGVLEEGVPEELAQVALKLRYR